MFEPLCGPAGPGRPVSTDGATKVGAKRKAEALEEEGEDGRPKKRVRLGQAATQWITIYNAHKPMKQRYHYNVRHDRISQHVDKGNDDILYISSVACSQELWALIMDAGTGFTAQVWEYSPNQFLPKDWIVEQWEARPSPPAAPPPGAPPLCLCCAPSGVRCGEGALYCAQDGYYITCLAGSASAASLVVMSKGTPYTQQSYKVSDSFPFKWINKKWKEGFYVTSMATSGTRWAVVMSRNAGFVDQCVELDFLYPSEGIHRRWDGGFRITCCAATPDQARLSPPRSFH